MKRTIMNMIKYALAAVMTMVAAICLFVMVTDGNDVSVMQGIGTTVIFLVAVLMTLAYNED